MTREQLHAKGWTTYYNTFGYEKWASPDQTAVMPFEHAVMTQELADYYGIIFPVKA